MSKKDYSILEKAFGCDFVVKLPEERSTGQVKTSVNINSVFILLKNLSFQNAFKADIYYC